VNGNLEALALGLQNLITNAVRYGDKERPEIHIRAYRDRKAWIIVVKDNGAGIERKYWQEIFKPLKRLPSSTQRGAGMGLFICSEIIRHHGGTLWIDSKLGKVFQEFPKKFPQRKPSP